MHFRLTSYESHFLNGVIRCYTEAVHQIADDYYSLEERLAWAPEAPDMVTWASSLSGNKVILALGAGNEVLGFADYLLQKKNINRLYVLPEAQGKGIGTALLASVEQALLALGLRGVFSLESSLNARGFYEKNGYSCTGSRTVLFNSMEYRNLLMEKQILGR
jgi:GNAT superfamily N-acetyltransferase